MKKIFTILILMILVFGISSVLAQDTLAEEIVAVSSAGGSSGQLVSVVHNVQNDTKEIASPVVATQITASSSSGLESRDLQVSPTEIKEVTSTSVGGGSGFSISAYAYGRCAVDDAKLDKLHSLVTQIRQVSETEDKEKYHELDMQIRKLSQEVKDDKQRCLESDEPTQDVVETEVITIEACAHDKDFERKIVYYKKLHELSDEELKEKGFQSKEEIETIIDEINKEWKLARERCSIKVRINAQESLVVKPVTAEDAIEITEYYKIKMDKIVASDEDGNNQIHELKELRAEIDKLIESLLKNKDEIKLEEISSIVETIRTKPGEIIADNVAINTINKKIVVTVNKKDLKIIPIEKQVVIQDGNIEVKAQELSIKNNILKVGNSEVRLTASDVVRQFEIEPKEIELKEENNKAVYIIKIDEDRKLLGLISVKAEKYLTIDATNQSAGIVKEELPWWVFMTTKPE